MTKAEFVRDLTARIEELEAARDRSSNVLLGEGFVVTCGGLSLKFDIANKTATNPTTTRPELATRFTRRDAESVAANVTNGKGEKGKAVFVRDAIIQLIEETKSVIQSMA